MVNKFHFGIHGKALAEQKAGRTANEIRGIRNILKTPSQTNAVTNREIRRFRKKIGK